MNSGYNSFVPFDRELIEARLALDLIPSRDIAKVAADALEAGVDGSATLRLAILESPTFFEIRDLLPDAMKEMGLAHIGKGEASRRLAKSLVSAILKDNDDPLRFLATFEKLYVDAGYPNEIRSLGTLHDEVFIRFATEEENRAFVRARLREFIA